jgi:integrase/recombinase XerD
MKHAIRRAEIYARSEVEAILSALRQPRDRVFLMTVYACGLRLAEARHLKTDDIDRARMQLRVRKGKGGKERSMVQRQCGTLPDRQPTTTRPRRKRHGG